MDGGRDLPFVYPEPHEVDITVLAQGYQAKQVVVKMRQDTLIYALDVEL